MTVVIRCVVVVLALMFPERTVATHSRKSACRPRLVMIKFLLGGLHGRPSTFGNKLSVYRALG